MNVCHPVACGLTTDELHIDVNDQHALVIRACGRLKHQSLIFNLNLGLPRLQCIEADGGLNLLLSVLESDRSQAGAPVRIIRNGGNRAHEVL